MDTSQLQEALQLMVVGMVTVFAVLCIVIAVGNLLISVVNKFFPEEEAAKAPKQSPSNAIDKNVEQAISMAISQITNGKGRAEKIEKI